MLRTFLEQPNRVEARAWLFQVHLWMGLLLGLYMAAIGLTGTALIFRPEIEPRLINRAVHGSTPGKPFQAAWDNVRRAYPRHAISAISLNQYPGTTLDDPYRVKLQTGSRTFFAYVDSSTGALAGVQHPVIQWIQELHFKLFAGYTGVAINAVGAVLFVVMCVTGAIIWWPGRRQWRQGFRVRRATRWQVVNYDLHHVVGIVSALLLGAVAAAAVVSAVEYRAAYHPEQVAWQSQVDAWPVDLDAVVGAANAAVPGGRGTFLYLPTGPDASFRFDKTVNGMAYRIFLDQQDGRVLRINNVPPDTSFQARVDKWAGLIHYGRFWGYASRSAWVVLGLAVPILFVSGVLMWWHRVVVKTLRRRAA
jgi:uncharacterized iron-regulated membrane protein